MKASTCAQVRDALERAVAQETALQDREPDLDLVDPGSVQGCVDEGETATMMATEIRPAALVAVVMNVEITKTRRSEHARDDFQEVVHGTDGTLLDDTSEHAPGADIKGAEQMTHAASDILEFVPHGSIWLRQSGARRPRAPCIGFSSMQTTTASVASSKSRQMRRTFHFAKSGSGLWSQYRRRCGRSPLLLRIRCTVLRLMLMPD